MIVQSYCVSDATMISLQGGGGISAYKLFICLTSICNLQTPSEPEAQ